MKAAAAFLLAVALLAGCAREGEISERELRSIVLQPADLPPAFVRFDAGRILFADLQPGPRSDPARFDRKVGWKARYRRPGSLGTEGPLVVGSTVDLFATEEGAERDLDAYRAQFEEEVKSTAVEGRMVRATAIGDGAVAVSVLQETGAISVRFFTIAWRHGNVTASIVAQGFEGKLALADVVELARKQERRIAAAAAD